MAPDKKDMKRKAAAAGANDAPAKKTKKVEPQPSQTPKDTSKATQKDKKEEGTTKGAKPDPTPKANGEQSKRQIKPRKRAADFLSSDGEEESKPEAKPAAKKAETEKKNKETSNKKSKKDEKEDVSAAATKKAAFSKAEGANAKSKAKKTEPVVEEPEEDDASDNDAASVSGGGEDDSEGENDQTAALIQGFESSGDEDASGDEGFDPENPVPKIPDSKKAKRKILKKQKRAAEEGPGDSPGTVYIGRIPHGFYEHQMRAYFSQFGDITRLRLSRNRITGRSKHYAFVEFSSVAVAKIVAETMDNYLMYGHILKCKYIPTEQLHPEIWKGANRRFKRTPWNRIEKKRVNQAKTREQWTERIGREQKRRLAKANKLKDLGYELDLPELMSVDQVPVQEEAKAIEGSNESTEEPAKAIEAPSSSKETEANKNDDDTPKKSKKEKKGTQAVAEKEAPKKEDAKKEKKGTQAVAEKEAPKKEDAKKEKKGTQAVAEQEAPKKDDSKKEKKGANEQAKTGPKKKAEKKKAGAKA